MFGMPSTKREGQTMLNMCMEQCEGVYLMDEIERLREALRQADMWHQNYKEAAAHQHRELREATTDLLNAIDGLFPTDGPVKVRVRAALKEKE